MFVNYKMYRTLCSIYEIVDISTLVNKRTKLEHRLTRSIINVILRNKNIIDIKALKCSSRNNSITFNFKTF